jgi:hypothetical protein
MESNSPTSALVANLTYELQVDVAWLAGIFDGEGCLSMPTNGRGNGYALRFEIYNTDSSLLEKASRIISELHLPHSNKEALKSKFNSFSKKAGNRITMTQRENCIVLLEYLLPHLTGKKQVALAMVDLFKNRKKGESWTEKDLLKANAIRKKFMPRSYKI